MNKHRVRASVNPTNRIIAKSEHGIRQVAFPYDIIMVLDFINLVVVVDLWTSIPCIFPQNHLTN